MDESYLKRELERIAGEVDDDARLPQRTRTRGWIRLGRNGIAAASAAAVVVVGALLVPNLLERPTVLPPGGGPEVEGFDGRLVKSGTWKDGTWYLSTYYAEGRLCLWFFYEGSGDSGCRPFRPSLRVYVLSTNSYVDSDPAVDFPASVYGFAPKHASQVEYRLRDGGVIPIQLVEAPYEIGARFFALVSVGGPGRLVVRDEEGVVVATDEVTPSDLEEGRLNLGPDEVVVAKGKFQGEVWSVRIMERSGRTCFMVYDGDGGTGTCAPRERALSYVATHHRIPRTVVVVGAVDKRVGATDCFDCRWEARLTSISGGEVRRVEYVQGLEDVPFHFFVALVEPQSRRFSAELIIVDANGRIFDRDQLCNGDPLTPGGSCVGPDREGA